MRIQITFRSGTQIEADVEEFTVGIRNVSGSLGKLDWITPAGATRTLQHVDPTEVVAIVAIKEPGDDGECTRQQVEVGLPGSGETIPGRRNPKCPVHATGGR